MKRCSWPGTDPLMIAYHDEEWGLPLRDDQKLFEFMVLDAFQAGLSWRIVLHKRAAMHQAFAGFNPNKVAKFGEADVERLVATEGIIRNRQKIVATISNANCFVAAQREFGSFADYIWQFVGGKPIINRYTQDSDIPASSPQSDAMSQALRAHGFKFVGTTICYAFMQAAGMVNDHVVTCFRYRQLAANSKSERG